MVAFNRSSLALTTALFSSFALTGSALAGESLKLWPRGMVTIQPVHAQQCAPETAAPIRLAQASPAKSPSQAELVAEVASLLEACSYDGSPIKVNAKALNFASQGGARDVVREIMRFTGLPQNFEVVEGPVPNAAALIVLDDKKIPRRVIAYNTRFMQLVREATRNSDWAPISIMAHEVGHHLSGHTLLAGGSQPPIELEADKFSGFVLQKMGASLADARRAIETLVPEADGPTHPGRARRVAAIEAGWHEACEQRTGRCEADTPAVAQQQPAPSPAPSAPIVAIPKTTTPPVAAAPAEPPPQAAAGQPAILPRPDAQAIPSKFSRFIYDEAGLLDPTTLAAFEKQFFEHAEKNNVEIVTLIVKNLHGMSADDYAWAMLRQLRVGKLDVGNGAVMVYAPGEKKFGAAFGPGIAHEIHNHTARYQASAERFFNEGGLKHCQSKGQCNAAWSELMLNSADHVRRDTRWPDWNITFADFGAIHGQMLQELKANFPKPSLYNGKIARLHGTVVSVGRPTDPELARKIPEVAGEIPVLVRGPNGEMLVLRTRAETMQIQPSGKLETGKRYAFVAREQSLSHNLKDMQFFSTLSYVLAP
ncbi:MAG: TPM domain-containing protein [Proteobacteria bacterium]|nr:TPM domain-containing protein [Pseudomonadota bacterium]